MVNMSDWTLENTPASVQKLGNTNLYASISSQRNDKGKPVYWVAPKDYLGKKVSRFDDDLNFVMSVLNCDDPLYIYFFPMRF